MASLKLKWFAVCCPDFQVRAAPKGFRGFAAKGLLLIMRSAIKTISLLVCILILTGCKKTAAIWGTWQQTSVRQVNKINDSTTYDMTSYITSGGVVFTFTVNGAYFSTNSSGHYIQSGNILELSDTAYSRPHSIYFTVSTLTDQLLILQHTDTISTSPITTVQYTYTLSPV